MVAFRGTSDFATALYDAEFRPRKLKMAGGESVWVHTGMWAVAKKLWKKLSPYLSVSIVGSSIHSKLRPHEGTST